MGSYNDRLLFQNGACMVINKLPGESSELLPDHSALSNGGFLVPVHRLDTPVSGCLLLAKTREAAAFLGDAFAGRSGRNVVEKRYWAVVEMPGVEGFAFPEGEFTHWLVENKKLNKSFAVPRDATVKRQDARAKKAVLRCRLIGEGEHYLFYEIDLVTGRHHQIRAQLAALGLHIKGDLKYGGRRSEKGGGIRLHAYSLAFPDPLDKNGMIRVHAMPPVMDRLWAGFAAAAGKT